MISVVILYPKSDDSTFDMDYYLNSHMPMFAEVFGEACHGWGVSAPAHKYHAVAWASIESHEVFKSRMAEHGDKVMADIANYTSSKPEMIVGEIVK